MRYIKRLMKLYPATVAKKQSQRDKDFGKDDKPQPNQNANRGKKSTSGDETVYLTITPKKLFLQMPNEYKDVGFVRKLRYARWNNDTYQWEVTAHPENLTMLQNYFGKRLVEQRPVAPEVDKKPSSFLKPDYNQILVYAKEGRLRLVFSYNKALISFIKTLPYYKYDDQNQWWTVPDTEVIRKDVEGFAQARGWKLSYAAMAEKPKRKLRPRKQDVPNYRSCPEEYISQLKMKRYSPNTIRTYTDLFEEFINHYPLQDPKEITEKEIISFIRYLVDERQVSASY